MSRLLKYCGLEIEYPSKSQGAICRELLDISAPLVGQEGCHFEGPYEWSGCRLERHDVVIDAGANIGCFAVFAAERVKKIYAFEPIDTPHQLLYRNLERNEIDNCEVVKAGLADRCGDAEMFTRTDNVGIGSLKDRGRFDTDTTQMQKAELTTLDAFVARNRPESVDFIKADIEGSEPELIEGARSVIRKYRPRMSICTYHDQTHPALLESLIRGIRPDYAIEHRWGKLYAF